MQQLATIVTGINDLHDKSITVLATIDGLLLRRMKADPNAGTRR